MQTAFSPQQLAEPRLAESEKILRACVHCGFCTATCPTYVLLGDELDSPRGRIYLIKSMLEHGERATREVVTHIDRCLSCLACMTTCPSGVHYMHLVDHARAHIEQTYRRDFADRLLRATLAAILPYPTRFRWAVRLARLAKPFRPLIAAAPSIGPRLAAMIDLAPPRLPAQRPAAAAGTVASPRKARVALLEGCAQRVLAPSINAAARRLLARHDVEVVPLRGEGCCGALTLHMGREADGLAFARRAVDVWSAAIDAGLDAILVTTSGCGTTIKDYGHMLREDRAYAQKAARVSALAKDIVEYVMTLDPVAPARKTGQTIAYHSACSMQHGQAIVDQPKRLLRAAGFIVRDPPEGHLCCGSAGVYNILQPDIAARLRDRKAANIAKTKPAAVATGNIGCMTQLAGATPRPLVHTVELLDWAAGGPLPAALAGAPSFAATDVA